MAIDAIRLGVAAAVLGDDARAAARVAREMGFAGLQFDAVWGGLDLTQLTSTGRREFRHVLSSQDQQLIGLRVDLGAKGFGPGADVDRLLARLDRIMEAAAGLTAPLVCVELGPLPPAPAEARPRPKVTPLQAGLILLPESMAAAPTPSQPAGPPPDRAFVAHVNAALVELGRRADRYNVVLAFRSDLAGFASLEQALRQADCPWFGIDLDPVAGLRDDWELDEIFSRLGPLVRHVRGRDAIAGAERRTKPTVIGRGGADWPALLSALDSADYRGWITVDPVDLTDRSGSAAAGLEFLKSLLR